MPLSLTAMNTLVDISVVKSAGESLNIVFSHLNDIFAVFKYWRQYCDPVRDKTSQ